MVVAVVAFVVVGVVVGGAVVPGVLMMLFVDPGAAVRVVDTNGIDSAFNAG
jgi:hypothetical protein